MSNNNKSIAGKDTAIGPSLHDGSCWKVMYFIYKFPSERHDPKKSRTAGTFTGHESPWQFQADLVDQRAGSLLRRISPECPRDHLYSYRPFALVPWVGLQLPELPAYEYMGKHGLPEYCWMEKYEAESTSNEHGFVQQLCMTDPRASDLAATHARPQQFNQSPVMPELGQGLRLDSLMPSGSYNRVPAAYPVGTNALINFGRQQSRTQHTSVQPLVPKPATYHTSVIQPRIHSAPSSGLVGTGLDQSI